MFNEVPLAQAKQRQADEYRRDDDQGVLDVLVHESPFPWCGSESLAQVGPGYGLRPFRDDGGAYRDIGIEPTTSS
jgi:hypothetical protein